MTTTVRTDAEIFGIFDTCSDLPLHYDPDEIYEMGRAIEQTVLQSPEVQALRKDAERWQFFMSNYDEYGTVPYIDGENLRAGVDAAMEKQP